MIVPARILLGMCVWVTVLAGAGCAIAEADEEPASAAGAEGAARVRGKLAFDAAAAGYASIEPLVGESPARTLARARTRVDELDRDLATLQRHCDPSQTALTVELARTSSLIARARAAADDSDADGTVDPSHLDAVLALTDEARLALREVRQQRLQRVE